MNIRKDIDYSEMYAELDKAMAADMTQMELYCEIGKAVCRRTEKGAAVAAAAYLSRQYPDVQGFSPRNLRRMREFYRTYQGQPALLSLAMELGWTQNVVIMESGLSTELWEWYLRAAMQFGWSKAELTRKIADNAYETIALTIFEADCSSAVEEETISHLGIIDYRYVVDEIQFLIPKVMYRGRPLREGRRRCRIFPARGTQIHWLSLTVYWTKYGVGLVSQYPAIKVRVGNPLLGISSSCCFIV